MTRAALIYPHQPESQGGRRHVRNGDGSNCQLCPGLDRQYRSQQAADSEATHRCDGPGDETYNRHQNREPSCVGEHHFAVNRERSHYGSSGGSIFGASPVKDSRNATMAGISE